MSAGKSVGEVACSRCEGIGSRGQVVGWLERNSLDTSVTMRRKKEERTVLAMDVDGLSYCVWKWELTADGCSFVCKEIIKTISCYRGGGWGQRRELNVLKRLHEMKKRSTVCCSIQIQRWKMGERERRSRTKAPIRLKVLISKSIKLLD